MAALPLVLVAAIADNGVIGSDNRLIWRLRTDLKRFRQLTTGCPVVMGRKTFLSIGKPLPGRETIVLTRDPGFAAEGVHVAHGLDEALALAQRLGAKMGAPAVIIGGGTEIYAQMLALADRLELTRVHAAPAGDARFPAWDESAFAEVAREDHPADSDNEHAFSFVSYRRRGGAGRG
ncbi:dihydrofolate reductase [Bosea minatitlanensis]|uniref:Dihydrofolate reductase n=1 Tax=Bosea minatitlanensis TaxID=128782 RepID=A0ABW0EXU2_9HYPH|nr:dihydrofolate reductase [Bosea minatitlanensis]MCT4492132.1 dihydrofolate reductase [Bosea minatitlanensis]